MLSAIDLYRVAASLHRLHVPVIPRAIDYLGRVLFSCWVPHGAKIGRGVVLGYGGLGIVIHEDAKIGDATHIDQGVTIGGNARERGVATIGRNVYIGAGAKVLGPISVGDGAIIGANAVVTTDVPAASVVVGIPARVIRSGVDTESYLLLRRNNE